MALQPPTTDAPTAGRPTASGDGTVASRRKGRLIGDIVVELGFASREEVEEAVEHARLEGVPTGRALVARKALRHDQLAQVLAERLGVRYVDLAAQEPDMGVVALLSSEAIKRYQAIPVELDEDGALVLAMADPTNILTVDDVAMITGRRVKVAAASVEDVAQLAGKLERLDESIEEIYDQEEPPEEAEDQILAQEADRDAPVIKLVHSLIAQAVSQGASDIHISPQEGVTQVEFRVDGVLRRAATIRPRMTAGVVSRVKIMADLDISERRVPQDGRLAVTLEGTRVDIRVVTLPLVYGEGVVMRILPGQVARDLGSLGLGGPQRVRLEATLARPHGAVLVTGPTGSGKSTTLYAALSALSGGERSVLTIEDPVESRLPGIKQIQVSARAGVTFQTGLRSMLRADPDVIMVGEIRDRDTAQIAVEAALTGHLVLSTMHTRDAPSALGRLTEMGVEPFLVSAAVDCIVAQRLVRVLCPHCKRPMSLSGEVRERYRLGESEAYEPVGCSRCGNTGYRGRAGIYEVMAVDDEIRSLVLDRALVADLAAAAERKGMSRLRDDGMEKVRAGVTSIAEVERTTATLL